jgi:hypothetical protein
MLIAAIIAAIGKHESSPRFYGDFIESGCPDVPLIARANSHLGQDCHRLLGFEMGELGGVFDQERAREAEGVDPDFVPAVLAPGHQKQPIPRCE